MSHQDLVIYVNQRSAVSKIIHNINFQFSEFKSNILLMEVKDNPAMFVTYCQKNSG